MQTVIGAKMQTATITGRSQANWNAAPRHS